MESTEQCRLELCGSGRLLLDAFTAIACALSWDKYFGLDIRLLNVGLYSRLHSIILPVAPAAVA